MIVKCNCDCKYCEEGICSKEEIALYNTGEEMDCDGKSYKYDEASGDCILVE